MTWNCAGLQELQVAEGHLQLTASKNHRASVIYSQGSKFCQQPEWACKRILSQLSLQERLQPGRHLDCSLL